MSLSSAARVVDVNPDESGMPEHDAGIRRRGQPERVGAAVHRARHRRHEVPPFDLRLQRPLELGGGFVRDRRRPDPEHHLR